MTQVIDGVLKEWGDWLCYQPFKGRKQRHIAGRVVTQALMAKPQTVSYRARLTLTVKRVPEVMVKISGFSKNAVRLKAHFDYISRNGAVDIEDEAGNLIGGKKQIKELHRDWQQSGYRIPGSGEKRREVFHLVLSMPPGTDSLSVKEAAREFARLQFPEHQFVFAAHEDEAHPHIHLAVKAVSLRGVRLNPRKADLQHWREAFAERLLEQGIEANATPRKARGIVKKAEKQAIRHIEARGTQSFVKAEQHKAIIEQLDSGVPPTNPAKHSIERNRQEVIAAYGKVARTLSRAPSSAEQQLALKIVNFVQQMPSVMTLHEQKVAFYQKLYKKEDRVVKPSGKVVEQSDEKQR